MLKEISGIGFDLEGTCIDLEPAHHQGHLMAAREVGLILTLEEAIDILPHFIGGPDEAVAEDIYQLGNKRHPISLILERSLYYFARFLNEMTEIPPRPGLLDFLQILRAKNLPGAIGTSTLRSQAEMYIAKSGLDRYFSQSMVVYPEDVSIPKPAPDTYLETARRMRIFPERQLVFEDSPRGIKAAVAAGSIAIGMPIYNMEGIRVRLLEAGAIEVFNSWNDVNLVSLENFGVRQDPSERIDS